MNVAEVGARLGGAAEALPAEEEWAAARAARPAGALCFLEPDFVREAGAAAGVAPEVAALVAALAGRVAADPVLAALAWYYHHLLYLAADPAPESIRRWPDLEGVLGEPGALFTLLALLSGLPRTRDLYRAHAIPQVVFRDTMADVQRWLDDFRGHHGHWGIAPRHVSWLRNHFRGQLFHLVRLQFQFGRLWPGAIVFRRRAEGDGRGQAGGGRGGEGLRDGGGNGGGLAGRAVLALSEPGLRYRADGQLDGAGGVSDPDGAWESALVVDGTSISGNAILPVGRACADVTRLPAAEWEQALAPGDPVLHIHIPAGSPMDFHQCGESFRAALEFFPRHFPEYRFAAFACSSWLLDTQLDGLLGPQSNIVRLQREVYLLPGRGDGRSTLERVFGRVPEDLSDAAQAPRDSALRRAILDHLGGGGHLRSGRCILLTEDVLKWGEQAYRTI